MTFWRYEWGLWEIENAKVSVELAVIFFFKSGSTEDSPRM